MTVGNQRGTEYVRRLKTEVVVYWKSDNQEIDVKGEGSFCSQ